MQKLPQTIQKKEPMERALKTCTKASYIKFPGGYFQQRKTLFDDLTELNIIPDNDGD